MEEKKTLLYKTCGKITPETYTAYVDANLRRNVCIKILCVCYIALSTCAVVSIRAHIIRYVVVAILSIIISCSTVLWVRYRNIQTLIHRDLERYETDDMEYTTGFTDDFVCTKLTGFPAPGAVLYKDIQFVANTRHYIFLKSKGGMVFVVFKDCLADHEVADLLQFLKRKVNIKF